MMRIIQVDVPEKSIVYIVLPHDKSATYDAVKKIAYQRGLVTQCMLPKNLNNTMVVNVTLKQLFAKYSPYKIAKCFDNTLKIGIDVSHQQRKSYTAWSAILQGKNEAYHYNIFQ